MSRIRRSIVLLAGFLAAVPLYGEQPPGAAPGIVPKPVGVKVTGGEFRIAAGTQVVATGEAAAEAGKLIDALAPAMGFRLRLAEANSGKAGAIALALDPSLKGELGEEGYTLSVTSGGVEMRAAGGAGLFYAGQTLRQLLPPAIYRHAPVSDTPWAVPCVRITDRPRFAWRGLLIDPARHFIPKRDMMRFIDAMAMHKFNRLQVHLTDHQGWRIHIRRYPLLTQVGSRMHNTLNQRGDRAKIYGGYYTQDDIRELVRYAALRHVTIVPEIEMPGHTGAAIVAYPRLGVGTAALADVPAEKRWGRTGGIIAPRPETVTFMKNVLDEVVELFPSKFIHVGGDEANIGRWAGDAEMQALIRRLKLKDAHELHSWFIKQLDAHLTKRGRRLVGWDEILQGGLAPGATVMSWRGTKGGITAAKAGHDVIMAPTSHTYFDYRQTPDKSADPPGFGGSVITLEKVYSFEPIPKEISAEQAGHILGGQGQLWGELIPNERHREFMAYPRACALIEALWSPKQGRDWATFTGRLRRHLYRLKAAGIFYRELDVPAQL